MSIQFDQQYDRREILNFFETGLLPDDFKSEPEPLDIEFKTNYIEQAFQIGRCDSLDLNVYELQHASEYDPRVSLSKETFRLMANYGNRKALVLFTSSTSLNYRLSLVTLDIEWEGKKITKKYSNPRRYSFFLGPDSKTHTPNEFLVKKGRVATFDDLLNRFSIEVVNKEFYQKIAILFTELVGGERKIGSRTIKEVGMLKLPSIPKDNNHQKYEEFAVRLIGRLVFCWFLKKKKSDQGRPLIPDVVLSNEIVRDGHYYHNVLESLFFQVLNTPMDKRKDYVSSDYWQEIPFLNGGLFEPHDDDYYLSDSIGVSKHLNTLVIPDKWFLELFDVFDTYNFTIDENTSVDVELSIEPEMLGRIFENLLAEINPETGEVARKQTGSYYTPRTIVEYMVDQSLKYYLMKETKISDSKIIHLLSFGDESEDLSESEKDSLIDALDNIRILDPACGSGAFPMGVLQKILLVLQKIDPDASKWLNKLLDNISDPTAREYMRTKLEGERDLWNYTRKLGIIRKSIYGVDMQPIATEIAKLRFFLSLVVDEKVDDDDPNGNRGILALPNLEFKFVSANTLFGLSNEQQLFETGNIQRLKTLRDEYFSSYRNKESIKAQFQKLQEQMYKSVIEWGGKTSKSLSLSAWDPFSDEACDWFDPEWMFGIKEGFDIVIANPPWLFTKYVTWSNEVKKYIHENYLSVRTQGVRNRSRQAGKINMFAIFLLKGLRLLKGGAILNYIIPNNILRTTIYDTVRKQILDKYQIRKIVDLKSGVFSDVTASTIIMEIEANSPTKDSMIEIVENESLARSVTSYGTSNHINQIECKSNPSYVIDIFTTDKVREIYLKMERASIQLNKLVDVFNGIATYKNMHGILEQRINENSKPIIFGRNIARYGFTFSGKYVNYVRKELQRPRDENIFLAKEKLIMQRIGGILITAYDDSQYYTFNSVNNILLKNHVKCNLKYILGILNSRLMQFYYVTKFTNRSSLTVNISKTFLDQLPIFILDQSDNRSRADYDSMITLVDKTIDSERKGNRNDVESILSKTDDLVYNIYGLDSDDIEIVETEISNP